MLFVCRYQIYELVLENAFGKQITKLLVLPIFGFLRTLKRTGIILILITLKLSPIPVSNFLMMRYLIKCKIFQKSSRWYIYYELFEISNILLGDDEKKIKIRPPGIIHRATISKYVCYNIR